MNEETFKLQWAITELLREEDALFRKLTRVPAGKEYISVLREIRDNLLVMYQKAELVVCTRSADDDRIDRYEDQLNEIFRRVMEAQKSIEEEKEGDLAGLVGIVG